MIRILKKHTDKILLGLSAVIMAVFYNRFGCPIRWLTGISCAGCGMTRAVLAILRLDFYEAWQYHPLVYLLPAVVVVYLFRKKIPKRLLTVLEWSAMALFIAVYVWRLCHHDPITTININNGVLSVFIKNFM